MHSRVAEHDARIAWSNDRTARVHVVVELHSACLMADHDGRPRADERAQVFISAKSSDFVHAQPVYRRLVDAGVPTFFSHETLPELRNADYRREIDQALDEVDHMIVVTSSLDNVLAPWVEAEWGFFINEKRSGRKHGNLITMVVGGLAPGDLPPALRYYEVIPLDGEALDKVLLYVREPLRRRSPLHAAPTRSRRPVFRESATFGGQPNVHLLAVARTDPRRHWRIRRRGACV